MPIKVQLLLPDNLKSSYLRANFIESGSVYSTKKPSLNSAIDNNKHTLQFKFELTDNVTREPVALNKIVSLKISNDPEFYSASTVELLSIPSAGSYSSTTNYLVNLNPNYFFGTSQTLESSRSTAAGDGRFIVNNWPLSATGGLSTVYMQAVVQSISGDEGTYPEGYAIYDQIAWQGELPSTPGRVSLLSNNSDWVGSQTLAHFKQSSDAFSGISSTGVSSYIGDFVEFLETNLKSTRVTTTGNFRTLGSKYAATLLSLTANRVDYNGDSPTTGTGVAIASNITLNAGSGRGALLTSATSTRTSSTPGYFTQGYISLALNTSTSEYRYIGKLVAGAENITIKITSANNAAPVAVLSRSGSAFTQATTLPEHTRSLFLLGGLFEIFVAKTSDSQLICSAYFTATDNQSYLLCDSLLPDFTTDVISSAFGVSINAADGTARIEEISQAIGRSWLSADLGDCETEDYHPINFPVVKVDNWLTSVNVDDDWIYYNTNISAPTKNPVYTSYLIFPKLDSGEIAELQCGKPTLSSRFRLDMSFTHANNILYTSFSTQHTQELNSENNQRPMVSRTMPGYVPSTEPFDCSTVTVFFDATRREIYAVSRLFNNTVSTHVLARYTPDTADTFSIEISDTNPVGSVGITNDSVANGTWIILRKNNSFEGSVQLSNKLLPHDSGLGYYFSIGCLANTFGNVSSNTIIRNLAVYGLPELNRDEILDPVNTRHFLKSDTGTTNGKPWLGQYLLAGATDFDKWDYVVPEANGYEILVQVTTTGNNIINTATPSIVDGYTVKAGDVILVKDQTDISENGLYLVINAGTNGTWTKLSYGSPYLTGQKNQPISIVNGTINGGTLWYSDYPEGLVSSTSLIFKSTVFAKRIDFSSLSAFYSSISPTLMEIKALWTSRNLPAEAFNIKFRFFADNISTIGSAKTDWFELDLNPLTTTAISGAYNELLQKILVYSDSQTIPGLVFTEPVEDPNDQTNTGTRPLTIINNEKVWSAIRMPMGFKMASAISKETTDPEIIESGSYRGWNLAPRLWFKLFAKATPRERNKTNNVIQQARTRAFSHAFVSGSANNLSLPKKVDIIAPADTDSLRPTISTVIDPSVRSAVLSILANDSQSGNLAFRVGKETDYGVVEYSPWQSWSQYNLGGTTKYSVYLYGTSKKNLLGSVDANTANLNAGMIGARKVWVQVIDRVGNISESYPLTLFAPGLSIVDTTAPSGTAEFYNTTTESKAEYTNKTWNWLKLDTQDRVTTVKDFRVRIITANGPGGWSSWNYLKEFNPVSFTGLQEGIRQLEVQFRDYGNNISPAQDFYSPLVSQDNLVFVSSTVWQKTSTNLESAYFGGVKQQTFTGMKLVPATGSQYTSLTAFTLLDTVTGRTLNLRTVDNLTITGTAVSYVIDSTSGLIIFASAVSNYSSVTVNVSRNSAILYEWDNNTFSQIADLGNYNELCITSMTSYSGGIVIGTASGNIYLYDGKVISGSYFTAQDVIRLPIASLKIHRFEHETNSYVYASTDKKPRLYRCLVDDLKTGSSWVRVASSGDLDLSSGGALSMVSSFNKLFIGCRNSKILRYTRTSNKYATESEILESSVLVSQNLGLNESTNSTAITLSVAPNSVIAGISERPEIWTYSEEYVNNPESSDLWTKINFDEMFVQDPAPAQYYFTDTNYKGNTTQRISSYIGQIGLYDEFMPGKKKDYLKLSATSSGISLYDFSLGTDWEQIINANQPSLLLDNPVKVATIINITLSGLQSIDSISVLNNDRVLVKNQTVQSENGIYVASSGIWVRDGDFNQSSGLVYRTGVYVTSGLINSKSTWILTTQAPYVFGTTAFIFEKPKYTIDIETQNVSGTGKQGVSVSDSYWNYNVKYSTAGLTIDSGSNSKTVSFPNIDDSYFVSMSVTDSQPNPNSQLIKAWTFASTGSNEDTGPYWGTGSTGTYDAWFAGSYVVPVTSGTITNTAGTVLSESTSSEASFTTTNYSLRVSTDTSLKSGNPKIVWQNTDIYSNNVTNFSVNTTKSIVVDNMCYIEVKLKTVYSSTLNTNNSSAKINLYYSSNSGQNKNYISQPIANNEEYNTYRFRPSWNGIVNYIAFEFADFDNIPANFDIDYIKIIKINGYASIASAPSRIRIGIDGRDLSIWYGNNNEPLFYQKNFLDLKSSKKSLKFGKLDSEDGASEYIYGGLKFTVGNVYSPTKINISDFHMTWRFPSTGGVRQIVHHMGSIYALTDGSITQRKSDNPDDRQMKTFKYDSGREVWISETNFHAREIINNDLLGVIRPLTSLSHNGIMLLCGQYGSIIE